MKFIFDSEKKNRPGERVRSRHFGAVLANTAATSHRGLFKFKLIKIK